MSRGSTLNVSLTPKQLQQVRQRVAREGYGSASEVVREGLRLLFSQQGPARQKAPTPSRLAAGYRACASQDRRIAREWSKMQDAWPDK